MIEKEIVGALKDPRRLDLLVDEFRRGRDIRDLLTLLNSKNEEIIGIASWIAGEIRIDPANAQPLISRLHQLVNHETPAIRFNAVGALYPFLDFADPAAKEMLVRLSSDSNEGVRLMAQAALKRMSEK
jgi:hypothetical protein